MTLLNGQSLLTSTLAGLTNTYSAVLRTSGNKSISLEDLSSSDVLAQLGSNNSFLQYLTSNFSNIDSDGDGNINAGDLNKLTQTMQQKGLTYNEIAQLCASGSSGMSSSLTDTVLTYFNQIDKNGDGRVTSQEITEFSFEADKHEMENKYKAFKSSSMSMFYGSESTDDDTSSVLDSMYPTKNKTT